MPRFSPHQGGAGSDPEPVDSQSRASVGQRREFYAGECQFADVPDWAAVYVGYCAFNGFMVGYGDDIFGASDPVTPAAACTIILRYLDLARNTGGIRYRL